MFFEIQVFINCLILALSAFSFGFYFGYTRFWEENVEIQDLGNGNYTLRCKKISFDCSRCHGKMTISLDDNSTITIGCNHCDLHK